MKNLLSIKMYISFSKCAWMNIQGGSGFISRFLNHVKYKSSINGNVMVP